MLFHSTYGLRPAVHAAADRLRAAGHRVQVPDLFEGRTFETFEEGVAHLEEVGRDELLKRAVLAAAPFSDQGLVYAGFDFGGSVAQHLALADDKARGLLLLHGTADLEDDTSADELPVQLHMADPDPFETHDWLTAWYLRMRRPGRRGDPQLPGCGAPVHGPGPGRLRRGRRRGGLAHRAGVPRQPVGGGRNGQGPALGAPGPAVCGAVSAIRRGRRSTCSACARPGPR